MDGHEKAPNNYGELRPISKRNQGMLLCTRIGSMDVRSTSESPARSTRRESRERIRQLLVGSGRPDEAILVAMCTVVTKMLGARGTESQSNHHIIPEQGEFDWYHPKVRPRTIRTLDISLVPSM